MKYKQLVIGIIIGALLFSFLPVKAAMSEYFKSIKVEGDGKMAASIGLMPPDGSTSDWLEIYAKDKDTLHFTKENALTYADIKCGDVNGLSFRVRDNCLEILSKGSIIGKIALD